MKICFSSQMKRLDEISIDEYGIPGMVLMENAGLAVVEELLKLQLPKKRAEVVCGTGNNGGDGFVAARHLHNRGWDVDVFICGDIGRIKGDALANLRILRNMGIPVYSIESGSMDFMIGLLKDSPVIIDALLGTGFEGRLKDLHRDIINIMNQSESVLISIDLPSGLDADTGFAESGCIHADHTVTFQIPKVGLLINDGPRACGNLKVADISIPKGAIDTMELSMSMLEQDMIKRLIPQRDFNTHKGSFGSVFAAACSKGMEGSGIMSSRAALRSGAGIVILGMPESTRSSISADSLEIMTRGLEDKATGTLSEACIPQLLEYAGKSDVLLIGPGLTDCDSIGRIVTEVIRNCEVPIIIDADGLNAISTHPEILKECRSGMVITPHPGEMARLCGCSSQDVQKDRIGCALGFAKEYNVIVVLKGYRTVIAMPNGDVFINPTGNPGMATAGSGDVLAGMIAGFAAQKFRLEDAVLCGVYIHGAAGDHAAGITGEYGLTAGDIVGNIPHTIKSIAGK